MKKFSILLISLFFCTNDFCFAAEFIDSGAESSVSEYSQILYGRKDLIRNDVIKSNNQLCLAVLNAHNGQFQSMTNIVNYLKDENAELKRELSECKAIKKK